MVGLGGESAMQEVSRGDPSAQRRQACGGGELHVARQACGGGRAWEEAARAAEAACHQLMHLGLAPDVADIESEDARTNRPSGRLRCGRV